MKKNTIQLFLITFSLILFGCGVTTSKKTGDDKQVTTQTETKSPSSQTQAKPKTQTPIVKSVNIPEATIKPIDIPEKQLFANPVRLKLNKDLIENKLGTSWYGVYAKNSKIGVH